MLGEKISIMKGNISFLDGILRIFGGIVFAGVFGAFGYWIAVLALIPIVTGLAGHCPLYSALGISTAKGDEPANEPVS